MRPLQMSAYLVEIESTGAGAKVARDLPYTFTPGTVQAQAQARNHSLSTITGKQQKRQIQKPLPATEYAPVIDVLGYNYEQEHK